MSGSDSIFGFCRRPRLISCTGDRTPAKEVLALKNF